MTLEEKKEIVENQAREQMKGKPTQMVEAYVSSRLQSLEDGNIDVNESGEITEGAN